MSNTTIIATLSLLATGSLALVGCDRDSPATEVPAAATTQEVAVGDPWDEDENENENENENGDRRSASVGPENAPVPEDPAAAAAKEPVRSGEPDAQDAFAEAGIADSSVLAAPAPPAPKARARARAKGKRNRSRRARASKGEAACGEGTCA